MKQETINKRVDRAIKLYIPNETQAVKDYMKELVLLTYQNLRLDLQVDERTGKPYSESKDLEFAISITLDDIDTNMFLEEARKETTK